MKKKGGEIMENKSMFVEKLGDLLVMYSRERIINMKYIKDNYHEWVIIEYVDNTIRVDVTGDSCIAIMHDIYKAML